MGWYHIMPSIAALLVVWSIPGYIFPYINKFRFNGHIYRRDVEDPHIKAHFMRDINLTGSAYLPKYLENLPAEQPK